MKRLWQMLLVVALGALGLAAGVSLAWAQQRADAQAREVMKAKLEHTQAVLEAIAIEDFAKAQTNAQKLSRLAQASGWQSRQTPEYELFTLEFRRRADALAQAASEKNVDGATMAYVQLTISCVNCHKHLRGRKTAALSTAHILL